MAESTVVNYAQNRANDDGIADKIIAEMQSSAIFQVNWEDLLMSAPVAISCIGACFVASSSKKVEGAKVPMIPGAKIQRPSSLQANLVVCSNLGLKAFIKAEAGLITIRQLSIQTQNEVADIIPILGDVTTAQKQLKGKMIQIQDNAKACYENSQAIDQKFQDWLDFICEFHTACVDENAAASEKLADQVLQIAAAETMVVSTTEVVENAKSEAKRLGKVLDSATTAFNKASDSYPTGWDIMGQQVVGGLAECMTTALNQAIPALVDNMNPMAKLKTAANIVQGFTNGGSTNKSESGQENQVSNQAAQAHATVPQRQQATTPPLTVVDPALAEAVKSVYLFDTLHTIINGADGNVNWTAAEGSSADSANATSKSQATKSGIAFVSSMLTSTKEEFQQLASNQEDSTSYLKLLASAEKIAKDILEESKKSKSSMTHKSPANDSEKVKQWRSEYNETYKKVYIIVTKARSTSMNSANPVPVYPQVDPAVQTAQINAKTAQAQALLTAGATRMTTTAEALKSTSDIYQKYASKLMDQEVSLAKIKTQLEKLTKENMALASDEIKSVLIECIKIIITLKAEIANLVRFFSALNSTIDVVVNRTVTSFLRTITSAVTANPDSPVLKIGTYTLTDVERHMIYHSSLTISAYFGLFADIGVMWRDISKAYIFGTRENPGGFKVAESLGITTSDSGAMMKKVQELEEWSQRSQNGIRELCQKKRSSIMNEMGERVREIQGVIKELPPAAVPPAIQSVVQSVTQAATTETNKVLEEAVARKPISQGPGIEKVIMKGSKHRDAS